MKQALIEESYPISFRAEDAKQLGDHIRTRHSVELVGMKRVGISNFLRFFLYHKDIVKTYINHGERHLFIPVDLNDLVEINSFPFWILTLKRIVDAVEKSHLEPKTKEAISAIFLNCIQSKDLFMTVDGVRQALNLIIDEDLIPTIFYLRFDRIKDLVTEEFFANLQGLIDAAAGKLAYVFTGSRTLDHIAPSIFTRKSLLGFSHIMNTKPADKKDIKIIFETFESRYNTSPSEKVLERLIELSGGHVQYLQLALIAIKECNIKNEAKLLEYLQETVFNDERINLQSEEIWDSLSHAEQDILKKILNEQEITEDERQNGRYLWDTGIISENKGQINIFSPLFDDYLEKHHKTTKAEKGAEFTKKESLLFNLLKENLDQVCERDKIIKAVWPEYEELGVSDWTIDRLVSRLRDKLKQQHSPYSLVTVKTRGYKLVSE